MQYTVEEIIGGAVYSLCFKHTNRFLHCRCLSTLKKGLTKFTGYKKNRNKGHTKKEVGCLRQTRIQVIV